MTIGVLALQGDFAAHLQLLDAHGVATQPVRTAAELEKCDALIIPGGESTTMSRLCDRYELWEPLRTRIANGMGVFGTCAGMILLAKSITGASRTFAQKTLGALDIDVARNAYGAQIESFEADIEIAGLAGEPVRATFIRAPQVTRVGPDVEVLARWNDRPVLVRQNHLMACAFHPEIADESRIHQLWLESLCRTEVKGLRTE